MKFYKAKLTLFVVSSDEVDALDISSYMAQKLVPHTVNYLNGEFHKAKNTIMRLQSGGPLTVSEIDNKPKDVEFPPFPEEAV